MGLILHNGAPIFRNERSEFLNIVQRVSKALSDSEEVGRSAKGT